VRVWSWQRWIAPAQQSGWVARLEQLGAAWTLTERPDRKRWLLAVYAPNRREVERLRSSCRGRVLDLPPGAWLPAKSPPPLRFGKRLIVHAELPPGARPGNDALVIPHGLAFGSGEHATTGLLLRALTQRTTWGRVLDLGTGSGVLALAARRLGATDITATDFDPDAIRTARENELRNFPHPRIVWRKGDVRRWRPGRGYDLVVANLFSGILAEVAGVIAASVRAGGELWVSGILRAQEAEVLRAYRAQDLRRIEVKRRGKWVMIRFTRPPVRDLTAAVKRTRRR
jgi:ribosomal protein L11 methyltransferase